MLKQEVTSMDPTELAAQARAAYEQKRTRECIALTATLALADPGNEEAEALQAALRADIERDMDDARELLEQSGTRDEQKKYRKAAEIILLKTLYLDPANDAAKVLLESARALPALPEVVAPAVHTREQEEIPFTVAPTPTKSKETKRAKKKVPFALIAFVVLAGGLLLTLQPRRTSPNALAAPVERSERAFQPALADVQRSTPPAVPQTPATDKTAIAVDPKTVASTTTPPGAAAPLTTIVTPAITVTANANMGTLAVSSPTAAEIYMGDRYLGSTPTTLQLPAGRQTLEYRHGDLRTVVSHDIKSNETTSSSITFQVTVQINAKPWAQVSLEGTPPRPLGQTPLSSITVPIGGVLLFENPNFPSKSFRITEKDSAIQVNFP